MDLESNKIELSSGDLQSPPDLESFPDLGERFEVLSLIGSGGMGRVFKVLDRQADRIMAVKLLRPELSSETALAKRFQQEVQAASRLTHNNIVTVLEGATTPDGSQMMVMEFLNGETLGDFIQKNKPIDQFLAIKICLQILEALGFAHSQGVLHRDLKPSNIILSPSPSMEMPLKASVVDFGIARVISQPAETHSGITRTGEMFGSPLYMSPEQCQGEVVCESSDLYSLGCVLYEALSGHPPYSGSNSFQVMTAHVSGTIPTIERSDVLSGLRVVVDTCLQKSPGDRYRDADSLIEDLNLVLHGERLRHAQSSGQRKLASIREKLKEGVSPSCGIGAFVVCLVLVLVTVCNTIPTTRGFEPTQMPHAEAPLIVIEKPEVKRPTVSKPELPKATVFESSGPRLTAAQTQEVLTYLDDKGRSNSGTLTDPSARIFSMGNGVFPVLVKRYRETTDTDQRLFIEGLLSSAKLVPPETFVSFVENGMRRNILVNDEGIAEISTLVLHRDPIVRSVSLHNLAVWYEQKNYYETGLRLHCPLPTYLAAAACWLLLNDENYEIRALAARVLRMASPATLTEETLKYSVLNDNALPVRRMAASALGGMLFHQNREYNRDVIRVLGYVIQGPDNDAVRESALSTLGQRSSNATMVTSIVRPLLKDRNKEIVFRAVEVLAKIGPGAESAVPDLIVLLNSDSSDNNWVIRALGAIGPAASSSVPAIEDAVERTSYPDRQQMETAARTAIKSINRLSHKYSPLLAK